MNLRLAVLMIACYMISHNKSNKARNRLRPPYHRNYAFAVYWNAQSFILEYNSDRTISRHDDFLSTALMNLEREFGWNVVADTLEDTIERTRKTNPLLEQLTFPNLGPFTYPDIDEGVHLKTKVNLNIRGLSEFIMDSIRFNSLHLVSHFNISIPVVILSGSYNADAKLSGVKKSLSGKFIITLTRLKMLIDLLFSISPIDDGKCLIKELRSKFYTDNISYQFNHRQTSSPSLVKLTKKWIRRRIENVVPKKLRNGAGKLLFDTINSYVSYFKPSYIVEQIEKYGRSQALMMTRQRRIINTYDATQ